MTFFPRLACLFLDDKPFAKKGKKRKDRGRGEGAKTRAGPLHRGPLQSTGGAISWSFIMKNTRRWCSKPIPFFRKEKWDSFCVARKSQRVCGALQTERVLPGRADSVDGQWSMSRPSDANHARTRVRAPARRPAAVFGGICSQPS